MKTILVLTDFSQAADNAADYALHLAKVMKANIKLCNAFTVPAEAPAAAQVAWPIMDYSTLKTEIEEELHLVTEKLSTETNAASGSSDFKPLITYTSEIGSVTEVARNLFNAEKPSLVIMGTSGTGGLTHFIMGSNCREMIEKACFPLLLVPPSAKFETIKKIAFATDLSAGDIDVIQSLSGLAGLFNAEILISHVTNENDDTKDKEYQHKAESFLNEVTCKINYPKIYYRRIRQMNVDSGLEWLVAHGQIDMMSIIHRKHNILDWIFKKSHTQKLARHIDLPMLIFPEGYHSNI